MTTLITGGTGRTGLSLAKLLHNENKPVLIATRSGKAPEPFKAVKFDWFDATTHEAALSPEANVDQVYIVPAPGSLDASAVIAFVDLAISRGVKRFALMSATPVEPDSKSRVPSGVVHQHLLDTGVDYIVVRPTWFIQNFEVNFGVSIREYDQIFSAAQDGRIPWVSVDDIAQATFEGLTAEKSPNKDIFVVGPELHSYEDAAKMLSSALGRTIAYKRYTVEEQAGFYIQLGIPPEFANMLAEMDRKVIQGSEEAVFNDSSAAAEGRKFVGKHTLLEFFQENKRGTGRTGLALAKLLHSVKKPVLIATRSGKAPEPFKAVKFDWFDETTHEAALSPEANVDQVYIVPVPGSLDASAVIAFVDLAISRGVKRFALLSAALIEPDSKSRVPSAAVHQHLLDTGVDYVVVRPTWFIQNFEANFGVSIREHDQIFSAAQDGRIPWVSTDDIAQATFEGLTAEKSPNKDIFVVGPELHSYEDAAKMLSSVLGRTITYKRYTVEEQAGFYIQLGAPPEFANMLAEVDKKVEQGSEEAVFNDSTAAAEGRKFVGKHTLLEFFQENKRGTGRTGFALAQLLHNANHPVVIATRTGKAPEPFKAVKFDWFDKTTHETALSAEANVDRVYIVKPPINTDASVVTSFVDLAISKGVKRFVLLSSTQVQPDRKSAAPGSVIHQHLVDIGVDYAVLRPTWFIQNFEANFGTSIRENDLIFSATQDGRIPWVSTDDIAQAAFECLTSEKSPNKDIFVVGPELLSYEDAAKIASSVLGRKIIFKRYTVEEQADFYVRVNWKAEYAKFLAELDKKIEQGSEEAIFTDPIVAVEGRKFVGKHTLLEYFEANRELWIK
ncbi:hypothetical protein CVT25_003479 [Psilocybe cyanescens]|uniref:NAD(P)-binding domain-containing protein n=1 Tax=Psilocybe cyanescens TaxID=93625 RepID=A0A409WM91_PSICY|nr:hypothetical protein CVT25_003479 [Psilocybe cyanescens]